MLILSNVRKLYDGTSSTATSLHRSVDLFIDGDRIHELRPHDAGLTIGDSHTLVDCSELTVTPGLIDCHGHVSVLGLGREDMEIMETHAALIHVEKILYKTLVDGACTTVRDVGGATHMMKRMVDEGVILGPRLKISICMLSTTGGHADFRGPDRCHGEISKLWREGPGRPSSVVDGPWEARKRVREIGACGADLIKLCTSPGVASPGDKLEHRDFTAEEIAAICDEAGARGMRVAAHAHSQSGIELAIDHGVNDIQHISFMDDRLAEKAHERGCTVTPTSWVIHALLDAEGLTPFVMEKVKQVAEVHQAAVASAAKAGLPILMGTDPVLPRMHGRNYMELVYLIEDGLSPLQAWHGSTGLAAVELGDEDLGVIRSGARADLLFAAADVIEDPGRLDHAGVLVEVMKDGACYRGGLPAIPQRTFRSTVEEHVK